MCFIELQCSIQVSKVYGSKMAPMETWTLKGKANSYEIQKSGWVGRNSIGMEKDSRDRVDMS